MNEPDAKKGTKTPPDPAEDYSRTIPPDELVVDRGPIEHAKCYWVWVGCYKDCPLFSPTVGTISFPKASEDIYARKDSQPNVRIAHPGQLHLMDIRRLDMIKAALPRTIIRWSRTVTGKTTGMLLKYPTEQETENRRAGGFPVFTLAHQVDDTPIGDFIYLVPAPGGVRPYEDRLPPTITDTKKLRIKASPNGWAPTGLWYPKPGDPWVKHNARTPLQEAIAAGAVNPDEAMTSGVEVVHGLGDLLD